MAQIKNDPKIEVLYNTAITEIVGDSQRLTGVKIKPVSQDGEIKELNLESSVNEKNLTETEKFAREFLYTTHGWRKIENDRKFPRYPRYTKKLRMKSRIDKLIKDNSSRLIS